MRHIFLNGELLPEAEAKISVFDRAALFGDAVYEVLAVLDGKLVDFEHHMQRLRRSLGELDIQAPHDADYWLPVLRELVARNALVEGTIYLQVSRGAADRDFLFPAPSTPPTITAFTQAKALVDNPVATRGLTIVTRPDLRWQRPDIKTVQLLYPSLMKMEAKAAGADDCWLVRDGVVTEGTSQNAHIVTREGVLVTHNLDRCILHGVTRIGVLTAAQAAGMAIQERPFTVEEAQGAAEAFVSAASLFVVPVTSIDGVAVGDSQPGPVAARLRADYIAAARLSAR